jgi:hypothetical protein
VWISISAEAGFDQLLCCSMAHTGHTCSPGCAFAGKIVRRGTYATATEHWNTLLHTASKSLYQQFRIIRQNLKPAQGKSIPGEQLAKEFKMPVPAPSAEYFISYDDKPELHVSVPQLFIASSAFLIA